MVSELGHAPAATCPSLSFFTCKVGTALRGALSQGDQAQARPTGHPTRKGWPRGLVGSAVRGSAWRCLEPRGVRGEGGGRQA